MDTVSIMTGEQTALIKELSVLLNPLKEIADRLQIKAKKIQYIEKERKNTPKGAGGYILMIFLSPLLAIVLSGVFWTAMAYISVITDASNISFLPGLNRFSPEAVIIFVYICMVVFSLFLMISSTWKRRITYIRV